MLKTRMASSTTPDTMDLTGHQQFASLTTIIYALSLIKVLHLYAVTLGPLSADSQFVNNRVQGRGHLGFQVLIC